MCARGAGANKYRRAGERTRATRPARGSHVHISTPTRAPLGTPRFGLPVHPLRRRRGLQRLVLLDARLVRAQQRAPVGSRVGARNSGALTLLLFGCALGCACALFLLLMFDGRM